MLLIQRRDKTGEVADVILEGGRSKLHISFEDCGIHVPAFDELIDVLGGEKIFVRLPVALDGEDRSIDLGLDGNLNLEVFLDRCQTGQAIPFVVLPLGEFGVPGRVDRSIQDFYFTFSAGSSSAAGGVDVDACLHGCLKEILSPVNGYFPSARMEGYRLFRHTPSSSFVIFTRKRREGFLPSLLDFA
jgi:hypothetical protein